MPGRSRSRPVPVVIPSYAGRESELLAKAFDEGWITSHGPYVAEFERRFSRYVRARYGVATTNGTAALHLSLAALRIGPGDEVIVPDATMVACLNAVLYTGATPVLVDVDPESWTLDPVRAADATSTRTRAVMPVHTYGHPADMDPIRAIARDRGAAVIEDAAEAHGSEYKGRRVGALGDLGCFSFYSTKILSTGEGGMVVTNQRRLAHRVERLHELAYASEDRNYRHTEVGFNYRLTDLQAAIGLAQLQQLPRFVRHRRECAAVYADILSSADGLTLPTEAPWARHAFWTYTVLVRGRAARRTRLASRLRRRGISTRMAFWPLHRQPFAPAGRTTAGRFANSDRIGREGLTLPFGNGIDLETVSAVSRKVLDSLRDVG